MEWVETTGKTLEEAKEIALDQLGVDETEAEFEIIEEAKNTFFGRVKSEARVRARVRPITPRAKEDHRENSKDRRSRKTTKIKNPTEKSLSVDENTSNDTAEPEDVEDVVSLEEQVNIGSQFVEGVLERFGKSATVSHKIIDEVAEIDVDGDQLGLLIGPKGATLSCLQDLTRTVIIRKTGGRTGRVVLDIAGYRTKRKESLSSFSIEIANKVSSSKTPIALEPMNSSDRKIVHDAVNQIEGITSFSEGEDPHRRVVVAPLEE